MAISIMDDTHVSSVVRKRKLLFILNELTYFVSHRLPIAVAARNEGYEVHVATVESLKSQSMQTLQDEGLVFHAIALSRSGRNVFSELKSLYAMYRLIRKLKPDVLHLVTIKPVIYGSLAARFAKVPAVVAAIPGLGYAFISQYFEARVLRRIIRRLYQHAFRHPRLKVIFQNKDDEEMLLNMGVLKKNQAQLILGSGVNLTHYVHTQEPKNNPLIVVMAARLLKDKGVLEYIEAAKLLRARGVNARFWLAGSIDLGNPSAISAEQLKACVHVQEIEYLGYCDNIPALFSKVNLVVLPSYREGLPRVLAEAAACGRAIVTTDVPGCRAAIIPGETGLLVKERDALSLSEAIYVLLNNDALRHQMGINGRRWAEHHFNIEQVVMAHLQIYSTLLKQSDSSSNVGWAVKPNGFKS